MDERVKKVMSEVFEVDPTDINDETSAFTIPNWDSLKHINLILALQEEFGVRFEDDEIPTMINFRIIVSTISAYVE